MLNPKISVVIPLYNAEKFLEKVLESVFRQTYPAHEIIVVDDGSTDSCPEILKRYAGRIRTARIPNSGSPSAPLNVALGMVTGDHVAFLDNDDFWFKNYLEKHVEYIRKYPDIGVFCTDLFWRLRHLGLRLKKRFPMMVYMEQLNFDTPMKVDVFKALLKENFAGICSNVVVKKEIADKVGPFDDGKIYSEDYDYLLRCAQLTNFVLISDALVYKTTHDTNITNDLIRMYEKNANVLQKIWQPLSAYREDSDLRILCEEALSHHFFAIGDHAFRLRMTSRAFAAYRDAFRFRRTFKCALYFSWCILKRLVGILIICLIGRENYEKIRGVDKEYVYG